MTRPRQLVWNYTVCPIDGMNGHWSALIWRQDYGVPDRPPGWNSDVAWTSREAATDAARTFITKRLKGLPKYEECLV